VDLPVPAALPDRPALTGANGIDAMSAHISPISSYVKIFAALMVLTVVTVAAAFYNMGALNNIVAMGIALLKAVLVILFFMHVKYSSKLIGLIVASSGLWLLIMFLITLSDYWTRGSFGILGK
jgi:cytochrome c oxidase subunit 4